MDRQSQYLLVEGNEDLGGSLKSRMENELQATVVWTQTYHDTQTLLQEPRFRFDAAVMNTVLPDAEQGDTIDLLVKKGIPAVVITTDVSDEERQQIWARNVADYFLAEDPNCEDNVLAALARLENNKSIPILVAEGSDVFRKIVSDLLQVHQYRILNCSTGARALEILEAHPEIKLALVDYDMEDMKGYELTRTIRSRRRTDSLAIIGISAQGDERMAAMFFKAGANDFIVRERFLIEEFYTRINQCLDTLNLIQTARDAAVTDYLTGLHNQKYFFEVGEKLFSSALRENISLVCAMLDIDQFKRINEIYGHDDGDVILKQVAARIRGRMRKADVLARFGGDKFCILSVNMGEDKAFTIFDDIRKLVMKSGVVLNPGKDPVTVTLSVGVTRILGDNLNSMIRRAEELLYTAKRTGRNHVLTDQSSR